MQNEMKGRSVGSGEGNVHPRTPPEILASGQPPLFRPALLNIRRNGPDGPVIRVSPPSHTVWATGALVSAALIVLLLTFGHYTRRERAVGVLVPATGLVRITAPQTGTILEVLVAEGDHVTAGQPLLPVSGDRNTTALGSTGEGVTASLASQSAGIEAEMQGLVTLSQRQHAGNKESEALIRHQLTQYDRQLDIIRQESTAYTVLLERIRPLVRKGIVSQLQIQQQEAQALESRSQLESLARQKADAQRQLAELQSQQAQLPLSLENKLSELRRQREQLLQATLDNEAGRLNTVLARVSGTVSALIAVAGQGVAAGETLLDVVPESSPLEAQLMVPSSAIGFVREGTPVHLHYVAFPYQKFGIQKGQVSRVSRSALTPNEAAALGSDVSEDRQSRYRVRVSLDAQSITAYGMAQHLLPGMSVEADLMLDRRTLFEWLMEPLLGARQRLEVSAR